MKFDFVDTEEVVRKTRKLKGLLQDDPYEDYTYKAYIESTEDTALSTLTNAKCLLTVLQEDDSGELEELWLFPVLPLHFDIRLRRTGSILHTFQRISTRLKPYNHRTRLSAQSYGSDPVDALRALRDQELELHLEVEKEDGEFEPIIWGTGTELFTENIGETNGPYVTEKIDKTLQQQLQSQETEFVKSPSN